MGDSPIYECPNCESSEMLVVKLAEPDDAQYLDCGTRYRLNIETVV